MKSSLIPIACGTALALMTGAAATHWFAVRDMVTLSSLRAPAGPSFAPAPVLPEPAPVPDDRIAREAKDLLAEVRSSEGVAPGNTARELVAERPVERKRSATPAAGTDARIEKLLTALEGAVDQNQELRDRLADTNRDVMELRFQVDSYSGQFRPLKVEQDPTFYDDGSGGVLPPLEAP